MTAPATIQEPTQAEVDHLADLIAQAHLSGVRFGPAPLARYLLAAGYGRLPEPEPVRYGECRACEQVKPLTAEGMVVEHDDPREGHGQCLLSRVTPARMVDPPEGGGTDE